MWYETSYRRHLLDMHINDNDAVYLSQFDADVYLENLKLAKLDNAMIYLQSHAGLCHYPTKSGQMHRGLADKPHEIKRLVDLCHANGITVTGYYSLIYNTYEHDRHLEWRMLGPDGKSVRDGSGAEVGKSDFASIKAGRYGLCCPNNPEYRAFVKTQIDEMMEYFDLDAMFFDMLFWSHPCYCAHCRARWESEVGGALPVENGKCDALWLKHRERRRVWMGEFAQFVTDYVKSKDPNMPVEHNVSAMMNADGTSSCSNPINEASDYAGGDLYGDIYNHSFTCKFYKNASKNQPFEYMFSRCQPGLRNHTMTKPHDVMLSSVMTTAAHHGATLVIDAIDPIGTMDRRVYERLGQIFAFEAQYEPYFKGEMVEDVGVYYSMQSKYNPDGNGKLQSHIGAVNAVKTMVFNHVPVGVCGEFNALSGYKVLVAPCNTAEDAAEDERIYNYVQNGGKLYISTAWNPSLIARLLDAEVLGATAHDVTYLAPEADSMGILDAYTKKYPMHFDGKASLIRLKSADCKVLATITLPYTAPSEVDFASIHSNPPGVATAHPALVYKKVGKGCVLWSAMPIECCEDELCRDVFYNAIRALFAGEKQSLISDAPQDAELTMFRSAHALYVHAVNLNERKTLAPKASFTIRVYTETEPQSVTLVPQNVPVPFAFADGYTIFESGQLDFFSTFEIQ